MPFSVKHPIPSDKLRFGVWGDHWKYFLRVLGDRDILEWYWSSKCILERSSHCWLISHLTVFFLVAKLKLLPMGRDFFRFAMSLVTLTLLASSAYCKIKGKNLICIRLYKNHSRYICMILEVHQLIHYVHAIHIFAMYVAYHSHTHTIIEIHWRSVRWLKPCWDPCTPQVLQAGHLRTC